MAPQTRLSARRQTRATAAKSAQTKPSAPTKPTTPTTATATATTTATPRRGRPPKKQSAPSGAASGVAKKPAKRGRPPVQRPDRRSGKFSIESPSKPLDSPKKRQQKQSAVPQKDNAHPQGTPKPVAKSNRKPPAQADTRKAGAGAQQTSGGRRTRRTNDLAEVSTRPRQEEPDETALRHSFGKDPVRSWLQTTEAVPPPAGNMAGSKKGETKRAPTGKTTLRKDVLQRNVEQSQNGEMAQDRSVQNSNSRITTRSTQMYKEKSYRDILEDGTDSVCLIMIPAKDRLSDGGLSKERTALLKDLMHTRGQYSHEYESQPESYESLIERMHMENERGVVTELHGVICPSAGTLRDRHILDTRLKEIYDNLVNQWDETWSEQPSILTQLPTPKPDYCVGFSKNAFSKAQRAKLSVIASGNTSFKATTRMWFPFLTCEVKSPNEGIESAENQNGYSMLIAVRSMVELFRAAKTDFTGSGHIMAFSVSYNHEWVYIHAYYPIVDEQEIKIRRRLVYKYCLETVEDPALSWSFVRNVYERWAPSHLDRLHKAIDAVDFGVPLPGAQAAPTASAQIGDRDPTVISVPEAMSLDNDSAVSASGNQGRRASSDEHTEQPSPKRPRR